MGPTSECSNHHVVHVDVRSNMSEVAHVLLGGGTQNISHGGLLCRDFLFKGATCNFILRFEKVNEILRFLKKKRF